MTNNGPHFRLAADHIVTRHDCQTHLVRRAVRRTIWAVRHREIGPFKVDTNPGSFQHRHEVGHDSSSDQPCAAVKAKCLALCVAEAGSDGGSEAAAEAGHDGH